MPEGIHPLYREGATRHHETSAKSRAAGKADRKAVKSDSSSTRGTVSDNMRYDERKVKSKKAEDLAKKNPLE